MSDVTFEPAKWYEVTARDDNPECENFEKTFDVNPFYSNNGINCFVQCGLCKQHMTIVSATLLDPQPELS